MKNFLLSILLAIPALFFSVQNSSGQLSPNGLLFDGIDDVATISWSFSYTGLLDFTLEAWIRCDTGDTGDWIEAIFGNYLYPSCYTCGDGLLLSLYEGKPAVHMGGPFIFANSPDLRDGHCHHIAATSDWSQSGSQSDRIIRFYIDGALVSTHNNLWTTGVTNPSNYPLYIGGYIMIPSFTPIEAPFKGLIKEIRAWNYKRSDADIQNTMNTVLSGNENGLIGYYRCNEGTGTVVNDYSVVNHDGNFGGGSTSNYPVWGTGCCAAGCQAPTNPFVTNITSTSAKLHWNIQDCALGYRIQYRPLGTTTWIVKNQNNNFGYKTITGLTPNTTYQWRVKTKCSANPNQFSAFTGIQTFSTPLRLSTSSMGGETNISISPNPFTTTATITINQQGEFDFILYDVFGREVSKSQIENSQSQIERGHLPAGVYFYQVAKEGKTIANGKVVVQ